MLGYNRCVRVSSPAEGPSRHVPWSRDVSWMLTDDTKLLGQRWKPSLFTAMSLPKVSPEQQDGPRRVLCPHGVAWWWHRWSGQQTWWQAGDKPVPLLRGSEHGSATWTYLGVCVTGPEAAQRQGWRGVPLGTRRGRSVPGHTHPRGGLSAFRSPRGRFSNHPAL